MTTVGESVLKMDRQHFNYRKELKTLFSQFGNNTSIEEEKTNKARANDTMADV